MTRLIRWPGFIAFVVIVALVAGVWFLAVDYFIKYAVQSAGTKAVGARVELASADLFLFPVGLELSGLQVTNPKKPMRNAVVADKIRINFHTGELIRGKKVIEEMSVTGVGFDKPRDTSGALPEKKSAAEKEASGAEKSGSRFKLPSLSMQSPGEILEKENLATVEAAKTLQDDVASARRGFETRLENLPDKETFEKHRQRLKELRSGDKSGGLLGAAGKVKEVREVKEDIQADLAALRQAKKDLSRTRGDLQTRLSDLKQAPARDAARLAEKYSLSPGGVANASALIFGPKYAGWVETGLEWYQRLAPYVSGMVQSRPQKEKQSRGEGINVEFASGRPVPEYWIKTARVSMAEGGMSGHIRDISSDQPTLGQPLRFAFSGSETAESLNIKGRMDRTKPVSPQDLAEFEILQYPLEGISLLDRPDLSIFMESARLETATGNIRIAGKELTADIRAGLDSAGFRVEPGKEDGFLAKIFADALGDVSSFDLAARVRGSLQQPEIELDSSIDSALSSALKKTIDRQQAELKSKLQQTISNQTRQQIQSVQSGFSGLDAIEQNLQKRLNAGSDVLPG
ncbi:MAG: TIGR03545 family protein [Desulfobacteraceae bacterium]|nr:TIGR03545 family protein [Desulfobacteraceae bacterium]